jgi:YggT family protein
MISNLFDLYQLMLFLRILSSWLPEYQGNQFFRFIAYCTDPYLDIFRRFIPPIGGMLDLSPIVALFALQFIERFVQIIIHSIFR